MKTDVLKLDGGKAGQVDLRPEIYGLEARADILHRVVNWQLAKRRAGTHAVKFRSDINARKKKLYRQKGTGGARHGARSANIFVGGGRAFGPIPRDHGHKLQKNIHGRTSFNSSGPDRPRSHPDAFEPQPGSPGQGRGRS